MSIWLEIEPDESYRCRTARQFKSIETNPSARRIANDTDQCRVIANHY